MTQVTTSAAQKKQRGKTSFYLPPELHEIARAQGLNLSGIARRAIIEHIVWSAEPGPVRAREVTGMSLPDLLRLMSDASLPLTATLTVRQEYGTDHPGVFLEWSEPDTLAMGMNGNSHAEQDSLSPGN